MGWLDEYNKALKKLKEEEKERTTSPKSPSKSTSKNGTSKGSSWMDNFNHELARLEAEEEESSAVIRVPMTTSVTKEKDDDGFDFFQNGAFEDGYQFGDIAKTILGTTADVGVGVVKGASKLVGGIVDAGAYGMAGIAEGVGDDDLADRLRKKAQKNTIDDFFKGTDEYLDKYSVLGRTSDSVAEAMGQIGGIILTGGLAGAAGLGAAGVSAVTTSAMGLSSVGSGMSEAYQSNPNVSDEEAATYGMIKGVVDAGSELIFGGLGKTVKALGISKGLSSLDDIFAQKLTSKITNNVAKNFIEYGVKASAEGVEEVLAGIGSAVGKKLTYMKDEELSQLIEDENLLEQFVVGAVSSGFSQSGLVPGMKKDSLLEANQTGRDFISGLSENEQKVVDKVFEERLAEKGELSKKEQNELYDKVLADMEKGYISTDTIEEVLGGESYQEYKSLVDKEDSEIRKIEQQLKELEEAPNTVGNSKKYDALQSQLEELRSSSKRDEFRQRFDEAFAERIKGDRLVESYNERARRGQKFEADVSKYDQKQQQTIQNAINSGTLNNTNRTHELVDFIAKVSADKGVLFDFTNNEKIKGTQFAVDGKIVNGYVTESGITLNVESPKYLESTVGHEITHVLEGTEFYDTLKSTIFEYAKSKGEYDTRLANLTELYKNVKDADVEAELTADLVGDYIFSDKDFVNRLSTENRNVFQKIYDEIKYLLKVATAGSKEARELEKVKKVFEDAYRASGKQSGTKHSLSDPDSLFDSITDEEWDEILKDVGYELEDSSYSVEEEAEVKPRYKGDTTTKGKVAKLTEERIEHLFRQYGASNPKYAQAYIATIHPRDFLSLTLSDESFQKWDKAAAEGTDEELYPLDIEKLKNNTQTPFLDIDTATGEVTGHEGRHRMRALLEAGVTEVPIAVYDSSTKYSKQEESSMRLTSQWFRGKAINDNFAAEVKNLIPLNAVNRSEIMAAYGGKGDVKFSLSESEVDETYFDAVVNRDWDTAERLVEEAAKKAGYTKVVYHGTDARFTEFDTDEESTAREQHAWMADYPDGTIFLAEDYDVADGYGERVMNLLLDTSEVKVFEEPDMYAHRAMDDMYGYEVYNYPVIAVKGKDMTIYATLDNTLVKSADTVTYGDGGEIIPLSERFNHRNSDIRFSLSEAVEETKDLMALHNLHSSELLKQLKMGGMAYPSIAITKPELFSHDGFGEVSVILHKDAIDPKKSKYNKIYSADAYTPTFPNVDYEASEQVAANITSKVNELYDKLPEYYQRSLRSLRDYSNIDDQLNRWGGEQRLVEKYADDYAMKQLYLAEKGEAVSVEKKTTETRMTDYQMKLYRTVADTIGEDVLKSFNEKGSFEKLGMARMAWLEKHGDALKNIYAEDWSSDGTMTKEEALEIANEQKPIYWKGEIDRALAFIKTGGVTVTETDDIGTTQAKIDEKIAGSDYKQWVDNLFSGIEGRSGIRNSKDLFTPSGNRRSFAQTHDPLTIDNIVKAMRKENQTGQGAFGGGSILGASAKEFGSIAEVKKNSGKLGMMDKAEHDAITDKINDTFWDIARRYANGKDIIDAQETIAEAVSKNESKAGIARYLKQYDYVYQYTDSIGDEIIELRDYIRSLPTPYFEAKPRRGVGFDEVGAFVIPYDADVKLKQELLNRGYAIAEYDPKVEGDRQRVVNQFEEYKFSLSNVGDTPYGRGTLGKDVAYVDPNAVAPIADNSTVPEKTQLTEDNATVSKEEMVEMFPDEPNAQTELEALYQEQAELENRMREMGDDVDPDEATQVSNRYMEVLARISELEGNESERVNSLGDENVPEEAEDVSGEVAPFKRPNPFDSRDAMKIYDRKIKAFIFENPEFTGLFQQEANIMLGELQRTDKGKRFYNDDLYYQTNGEQGFMGQKRNTSESIEELLDAYGMSYTEIESGLRAILRGGESVNTAAAKKIEFVINDRLSNGYTDFDTQKHVPANHEYLRMLDGYNANQVAQETASMLGDSDVPIEEAPIKEAPVLKPATPDIDAPIYDSVEKDAPNGQTALFPAKSPDGNPPRKTNGKTAKILPSKPKEGNIFKAWDWAKEHVFDHGMWVEDLSKATGNRALEEKWDFIRKSNARAQHLIGKGDGSVKALKDIRQTVLDSGKYDDFVDYMYHKHNISRMNLAARNLGPNKAVFGDSVTAQDSIEQCRLYETENPEFLDWAQDIYDYNDYLRDMLVEAGFITEEVADLWQEMYPHYVPIQRQGAGGFTFNSKNYKSVSYEAVKRATGGNADIDDLFDTIGNKTMQYYRMIARNNFGVELRETLGTSLERTYATLDEVLETLTSDEAILEAGKYGENPTFTVFEDGGRVKFEITEEMYESLKPRSAASQYRAPIVSAWSELFRKLTTEYNPAFMLTNPIKDVQDILLNSQHPAETYMYLPRSIWQQVSNGYWYREYVENGGESNSYFDTSKNQFDEGTPKWNLIARLNNHIEMTPRLAEYIASRAKGKSIEGAMLDASRVTTNFSAGGDVAKFLNANGCTFLNASIQGAVQQVRNVREAHHKGWMGYAGLLTRMALAGLPAALLNGMWEDDEDYEELADYVKQNYYVVSKTEDGRFIRIPKGRAVAVIQDAVDKVQSVATGDDELDLRTFLELAADNLKLAAENVAPNNPFDNNILAPVFQVARNQTWYDEDIVPSRLQDLPVAEQFDEKTDALSVALGEALNLSPKKINYLLNQYSGGVGDMLLPMMTPKAESGDDSIAGHLLAPIRDKFTTDSVLNSQVVTDFRAKQDELTVKANGKDASVEDKMMSTYLDTISYELNDLYAQKRAIQMSDKPNSEKYELSRELQRQINEAMEEALSSYQDVHVDGKYSEVGDRRFNYDSDKDTWYEIRKKNADGSDNYYYQQERKVAQAFGISSADYWNNQDSYDDALYYATSYGKNLTKTASKVFGVTTFAKYGKELSYLKADYDEKGNAISGSKKDKVIDYCNSMDADYGEKIILFKSQYPKDDTYNNDIIDYLNEREDLTYYDRKTILEELGFRVGSDGRVYWD